MFPSPERYLEVQSLSVQNRLVLYFVNSAHCKFSRVLTSTAKATPRSKSSSTSATGSSRVCAGTTTSWCPSKRHDCVNYRCGFTAREKFRGAWKNVGIRKNIRSGLKLYPKTPLNYISTTHQVFLLNGQFLVVYILELRIEIQVVIYHVLEDNNTLWFSSWIWGG